MSLQKIIKESVEKNPLGLKEALEEELRNRVSLALEAKMKEEDDMEDDDEDEDDEDDEVDEEAQPKWKVKIGKKTYTVTARNTAEANKKASASAKKEGNSGVSSGQIVKVQEAYNKDELDEDKFSDFWGKVFGDLDSKMKSFDGKKIADVNKVAKHLQQSMPKMPQAKAMSVANDYADYRSGKKSKDKAISDVAKSMASAQKVQEAYNKDSVDKAIASADKKGKPTSSKGKKLIHALLKGHSGK